METKKWGVFAYVVAEPPPGFANPRDLDPNAHAEVEAIIDAARKYERDMDVAYLVDYGDTFGIYRRKVTGPYAGPAERVDEPADSEPGDPVMLANFFKWALDQCPAERYAVFFWGHSFGPASMFAPPLPRLRILGLPELRGTLHAFHGKQLEVVLFKDCWMSTLETAFELKGSASYIVASQSLVPIASVWPYPELFGTFVSGDSSHEIAGSLVNVLGRFYDVAENRRPNTTVPFSALDLSQVDQVSVALKAVVSRLSDLPADRRRSILERSSIGDISLVDMGSLCANLGRVSATNKGATPHPLDIALENLIVEQYAQTPGFRGVSAFCFPSTGARASSPNDRYIWALLPFSRYMDFAIAAGTKWPDIAYDQLQPVPQA